VILEKFWNQAATDAKQRPGFQTRNTGKKYSHLNFPSLNCVIAKLGRIQYQRQITIYETNNTPLSQQYRCWMHSTVNQLRQHANQHAKQREHARGLRL
jgi:hypothetical protein